jgi:acyl carrier protein
MLLLGRVGLWTGSSRGVRLDILPSLEASLFELGADSLAAAELISAVEEKFCCELPLQAFFETPTPAMLGNLLRDARSLPSANADRSEPKTRLLRTIEAYTGSWKGTR